MTLQSHGLRRPPKDSVEQQIAALAPWFHNLRLPSGHQTAPDHPLGDFPRSKWWELAGSLPAYGSSVRPSKRSYSSTGK